MSKNDIQITTITKYLQKLQKTEFFGKLEIMFVENGAIKRVRKEQTFDEEGLKKEL